MMINDNGTMREATAEEMSLIAELTAQPETETMTQEDRLELLEAAVQDLALMMGGEE